MLLIPASGLWGAALGPRALNSASTEGLGCFPSQSRHVGHRHVALCKGVIIYWPTDTPTPVQVYEAKRDCAYLLPTFNRVFSSAEILSLVEQGARP